jgi:hypothetical protein
MSLGAGIFLFAVGAILAFAINITVDWIDLQVVGYILMAAGLLGIVLGVVLIARKRTAVSTTSSGVDPVSGNRVRRTVRSEDQL